MGTHAVTVSPLEEVAVTSKRPEVFTKWCRAFVRLLNIIGLSAGQGWGSLISAIIVFAIHTTTSCYSIQRDISAFREYRNDEEPFFRAVFLSGFLGIPNIVTYIGLLLAFTIGRRRYARLLCRVRDILNDLDDLPEVTRTGRSPNRTGEYMWAMSVTLIVVFYATKIHTGLVMCGGTSASFNTTTLSCAEWLGIVIAGGFVNLSLGLIAVKFMFAGLLLTYCLRIVNFELKAIVETILPSHSADLRRVGRFQLRLSEAMSRLCSDMAPELIAVMAVGVLAETSLVVLLLSTPPGVGWLLRLLRYLPLLAVSLVGPCETCQRLLTQLGRGRDLLLQLEWQRPELSPEVGLLLKTVERDLETVGDVGLYRLRRSTLLSIFSTIVTYIIVMAQFRMSE